jgi:asparagine synthase (glutamine-hydrolysing)
MKFLILHKRNAFQQDEPFGGSNIGVRKIFEQARKVIGDGRGMDEQWAGYDYTQENDATIQGVMDSPFKEYAFRSFFG